MALALRGARVIIACRDEDRARKAVREIKNRSHNMNVLFMEVDLANMRSIRDFCKNFLQKEKRLDILINNAGEYSEHTAKPVGDIVDTVELMFGCNYSHFTKQADKIFVDVRKNVFFFSVSLVLAIHLPSSRGLKIITNCSFNQQGKFCKVLRDSFKRYLGMFLVG